MKMRVIKISWYLVFFDVFQIMENGRRTNLYDFESCRRNI